MVERAPAAPQQRHRLGLHVLVVFPLEVLRGSTQRSIHGRQPSFSRRRRRTCRALHFFLESLTCVGGGGQPLIIHCLLRFSRIFPTMAYLNEVAPAPVTNLQGSATYNTTRLHICKIRPHLRVIFNWPGEVLNDKRQVGAGRGREERAVSVQPL